MASDKLKDGLDYRLALTGNGLTNALLDCETTTTLNITIAMNENSGKCDTDSEGRSFKTFKPGKISWDMNSSAVIELGESGVDAFDAIELVTKGTQLTAAIRENGTTVFSGPGIVHNTGLTLNDNDTATFTTTLNGNGPLTVGA